MLYPDIQQHVLALLSVNQQASKLPEIFHRLDDRVHFKGDYDLSHARSSVSNYLCENLCKPAVSQIGSLFVGSFVSAARISALLEFGDLETLLLFLREV